MHFIYQNITIKVKVKVKWILLLYHSTTHIGSICECKRKEKKQIFNIHIVYSFRKFSLFSTMTTQASLEEITLNCQKYKHHRNYIAIETGKKFSFFIIIIMTISKMKKIAIWWYHFWHHSFKKEIIPGKLMNENDHFQKKIHQGIYNRVVELKSRTNTKIKFFLFGKKSRISVPNFFFFNFNFVPKKINQRY